MTRPLPPLRWDALHSAQAERQWIDARAGESLAVPRLALVHYDQPAVIYGRRGGDSPGRRARAEGAGFAVLQRRSGGGAVLAGPWMAGFHVVVPPSHPIARLGAVGAMVWLGKAVSAALLLSHVANAPVESRDVAALREGADAALDWACYASLAHGELVDATGRKLLGLSQARGRFGALLSGGLLVGDTPWEALEYVHHGERPARSALRALASAGVAAVAPAADLPHLYARLATCVAIALDPEFVDGPAPGTAGGASISHAVRALAAAHP